VDERDAADAHLKETRVGGEVLLQGGFLRVRRDVVRLPDAREATREYVEHPGAVAVVPLLDDGPDPRVVLVRQWRHPLEKVLLEWPAGKRDADESPLACAMRELTEETGYRAREWAYGGFIHNAAAYSTERIWIWFARGLEPGPVQPDDGEFVETVTLRQRELEALDAAGTLTDVKTLVGLHWLQGWQRGARSLTFTSVGPAAGLP
jgi:ADP-ribose pyrophosphatase